MTDAPDSTTPNTTDEASSGVARRFGRTADAKLPDIALYARGLLLCIGLGVAYIIAVVFVPSPVRSPVIAGTILSLLGLALYALTFLFWLLLMHAMGVHGAGLVCLGVLTILPLVNLVTLAVAILVTESTLRQYGIRNGIIGASPRRVAYVMSTPHCESCYYNLTGNTSGRCPECGRKLPETEV